MKLKVTGLLCALLLLALPGQALAQEWEMVKVIFILALGVTGVFSVILFLGLLLLTIFLWIAGVTDELNEASNADSLASRAAGSPRNSSTSQFRPSGGILIKLYVYLSIIAAISFLPHGFSEFFEGMDIFSALISIPVLLSFLLLLVLVWKNFSIWFMRSWNNLYFIKKPGEKIPERPGTFRFVLFPLNPFSSFQTMSALCRESKKRLQTKPARRICLDTPFVLLWSFISFLAPAYLLSIPIIIVVTNTPNAVQGITLALLVSFMAMSISYMVIIGLISAYQRKSKDICEKADA